MRLKPYLALLGLCAVAPGCTPLKNVAETMICEPAAYCLGMDDFVCRCRNRQLADEAWYHFQSALPDCQYSDDFADGFVAGYADYLNNGGNGDPPAVPPFCYRTVKYQTPEGVEAINQWYAGWRHGTLMAKASGMRELEVIPLSAPPINAIERGYGPPIALPPTPEQLPPPHPAPNK